MNAYELVQEYISICGDHCNPYILIEPIENFDFDWDDEGLSCFIFERTKKLGCIPCSWHSMEENEGKELLRTMLGESLMLEYAPFGKSTKADLEDFLQKLHSLIGVPAAILSNTISYGPGSRGYDNIFPEDDKYELDIGIAIITNNWFAFLAHRGFD